jgi:hypothetical protein
MMLMQSYCFRRISTSNSGKDRMPLELEQMLLSRHPEELFAAEDDEDWQAWVAFFSRTREADGRSKGLVEVQL